LGKPRCPIATGLTVSRRIRWLAIAPGASVVLVRRIGGQGHFLLLELVTSYTPARPATSPGSSRHTAGNAPKPPRWPESSRRVRDVRNNYGETERPMPRPMPRPIPRPIPSIANCIIARWQSGGRPARHWYRRSRTSSTTRR
jgi:hypothetical protein